MAQPTRAGAGTLRLADQRAVEIQASSKGFDTGMRVGPFRI